MPRAFHFDPFRGIDNSILCTDDGRQATEDDMRFFFRRAEPELDRLTLEMCAAERAEGNPIPKWLLDAELAAFHRCRGRAAASA